MNNTVKNSQRSDVIQIDLLALVKACWRQVWLIILAALLCGSAAYLGTRYLITPTYRTYYSVYMNKTSDAGVSTAASTSELNTAAAILASAKVQEQATELAGADGYSVTVSTSVNANILTVYVAASDPKMAASYATALAEVAAEETERVVEGSSMEILDEPKIPTTISSPNYRRNTMMGLLVGAFLVCAVVVLLELLNDRIQDQAELEERYGISVLGAIPDWSNAGKGSNYSYYYGKEQKKAEV